MTSRTKQGSRGRVQRQGQLYRFTVAGIDYTTFIWQHGVQFRGRVEGHSQVPEQTGRTALAVRDALQKLLVTRSAST